MLGTSSSTDSSISATQIAVKYDEVDGGGGKLVEKSSKSRRIVKSRKTSKAWKVAKVIGSEEYLPKHRASVDSWVWASVKFAGLESSFDIASGLIMDKAKLMELLMLCHVFSPKEPVFFEPLCTEFLSAKRTSSLR